MAQIPLAPLPTAVSGSVFSSSVIVPRGWVTAGGLPAARQFASAPPPARVGPYWTAQGDRADYGRFLDEFGLDETEVAAASRERISQVAMPLGFSALSPAQSYRGGNGMFATRDVEAGQVLGPARLGGKLTLLASLTNHAKRPNSMLLPNVDGDLNMMATEPIAAGEEATLDYRQVASVNGWTTSDAPASFVQPNTASPFWIAMQRMRASGAITP